MQKQLQSVLNWLRLLDENGLLSLTNIGVIVVIVKIALATQINFAEISGLLTVLGGYHFKRYLSQVQETKVTTKDSALRRVQDDIDKIKLAQGFVQNGRTDDN